MTKKNIADGFDGITILNKYEYENFDDLPSITLGKQIVNIEPQTFRYCRNLRWIDVNEDNPFFSSVDGVLYDKNQKVLICYPANHPGYSYTIPSTVKSIESFAFSGSHKLQNIILNDGLLEIGDCGFEGCSNLTEIKLPKSLQTLGHVVFQGCSRIRNFNIPENLKCLKFPTLPESFETITVSADNPFYTVEDNVLYSKDLTTLIRVSRGHKADLFSVLPSVTKIESQAFGRCEQISKIYIPNTVKELGEYVFAFLEEHQTVVLPAGLYKNIDDFSSPFSLSKANFQTY